MGKGSATRSRILDVAQEAVLAKGFDATSIDEIVASAEITRSGFFYHFRDKNALHLAFDAAGELDYLAPTRVNLQLAEERAPAVTFMATREHAHAVAVD